MTSNQELRRLEAKNGAPEPMIVLCKAASKAAKEAREATMAAIAKLVDDAADKKKHKTSATTISDLTPALDAHAAEASLSPMTMSNNLPQDDADPPKNRQKGGRPKGSTLKSSQAEQENYQKACAEAARDFQNLSTNKRVGERRLKKGTLIQVIEDAKKRHNVEHLKIPKETIKSRIKQGSLVPNHRGLVSPMEQIEPLLVKLCILLGHARPTVSSCVS